MEFDFKSLKDKIENSPSSPSLSQKKNVGVIWRSSSFHFRELFRERGCLSLEYREIRPSVVFGQRKKNVLPGAGYAWTPGL